VVRGRAPRGRPRGPGISARPIAGIHSALTASAETEPSRRCCPFPARPSRAEPDETTWRKR
jgi:hypothetical protein